MVASAQRQAYVGSIRLLEHSCYGTNLRRLAPIQGLGEYHACLRQLRRQPSERCDLLRLLWDLSDSRRTGERTVGLRDAENVLALRKRVRCDSRMARLQLVPQGVGAVVAHSRKGAGG